MRQDGNVLCLKYHNFVKKKYPRDAMPVPTARMPCSNEAKTQNPLKFAWVLQTTEPISAAMWGDIAV